jgi:hypothetical protein
MAALGRCERRDTRLPPPSHSLRMGRLIHAGGDNTTDSRTEVVWTIVIGMDIPVIYALAVHGSGVKSS